MNYNRLTLQSSSNDRWRFSLTLLLFALLLLASFWAIAEEGFMALSLMLLILTGFATATLVKLFNRQSQRLQPVLRALVNDDVTLGLSDDEPLLNEFNQVRAQINQSKREIQAQNQFLQTMLTHLDVGILVLSDDNKLLQKNPALLKLLGALPDDINHQQWGALGSFISDAKKRCGTIMSWHQGQQQDTLSVRISCSTIHQKSAKIVSIQSIYQALQAKEQQAYKRLTHVLTHEIANSIMPMMSLAQTSQALLPQTLSFDSDEDKQDLTQALAAIARRAEHLDDFVNRFAEVSRLPQPALQRIELNALLSQILALYQHNNEVEWGRENALQEYWLMADAAQIEQVTVNLLKNALEALTDAAQKKIEVCVQYNELSQLMVDITDSGKGVEPHVQPEVFIPFFTTKNAGSGIGLSLSKQVMINHGGDLVYIDKSAAKTGLTGACFRMIFA